MTTERTYPAPITLTFDCDHPRLESHRGRKTFKVSHSYIGNGWSASHDQFGCGKDYATPEAAVRGLLESHGITATLVVEPVAEEAVPAESGTYPHSYTSALRRARRAMKAAGLPMGKIVGRYSPFGSSQTVIPGWYVSRLGCSETIALGCWEQKGTREERHAAKLAVIRLLRAAGLPFNAVGHLDCSY